MSDTSTTLLHMINTLLKYFDTFSKFLHATAQIVLSKSEVSLLELAIKILQFSHAFHRCSRGNPFKIVWVHTLVHEEQGFLIPLSALHCKQISGPQWDCHQVLESRLLTISIIS